MRQTINVGVFATLTCVIGCTVDQQQPDLTGQDIRLTVIHTADIHSRLFPYNFTPNKFDQDYGLLPGNGPYGGIAKIATMVKWIRKSSARSIWLDSGDVWEGAPIFNEFKGELEIRGGRSPASMVKYSATTSSISARPSCSSRSISGRSSRTSSRTTRSTTHPIRPSAR